MNHSKIIKITSISLVATAIVITIYKYGLHTESYILIIGLILLLIPLINQFIYDDNDNEKLINEKNNEITRLNAELKKYKEKEFKKEDVLKKTTQNVIKIELSNSKEELLNQFSNAVFNSLNAATGVFYTLTDEKWTPTQTYGVEKNKINLKEFDLDDGLVAQVAISKNHFILNDIPEKYFEGKSGLGKSLPKNIVFYPVVYSNTTFGVFEAGSYNTIDQKTIDALHTLCEKFFNRLNELKH